MTVEEAREAVLAADHYWAEHADVLDTINKDGWWDDTNIDAREAWYEAHADIWRPYMDLAALRVRASQVLRGNGIHPGEVATG